MNYIAECFSWKFLQEDACSGTIVQGHIKPFKRQLHEMVKHTQTISQLLPTNCLSVLGNFVKLTLKGLRTL